MKLIKNKKVILLILGILVFTLVIQQSFSKYVIEIKETKIQESLAFHFESEIAKVDGNSKYIVNDWDGISTKEINFDVRNYINNLSITERAIEYKMEATVVDGDSEIKDSTLLKLLIKDSTSGETIENNKTLTIGEGLNKNNYLLAITPNSNIENGKIFKIRIQITSIKPYEKQLVGELNIKVNRLKDYEVTLVEAKNGEYATLNIKVNNPNSDITIKYDNTKVILDKSGYIVNGLNVTKDTTINSFTIAKESLEKSRNYEINFVKLQDSLELGTDIIYE